MGKKKNWTKYELDFLEEKYGNVSIKTIAKTLGRSESGVRQKAQRLGYGAFLENGDYITLHQFMNCIGKKSGVSYIPVSWIQKRGFPVHYKTVNKCRFRVIYIDEFWEWAEKNMAYFDFSCIEENIFGEEPAWLKEKRRRDVANKNKITCKKWTKSEDSLLADLVERGFGYVEISKRLRRSSGAIIRRCLDLGISKRPKKADVHNHYTEEDIELIKKMLMNGYTYNEMQEATGRSEKALRGFVFRKYGTEVLDKARIKLKEEVA